MAPPTPPAESTRRLANEATSGRGSLTGKYKEATAGWEAQASREVQAALSWLGLAAGLATVSTMHKMAFAGGHSRGSRLAECWWALALLAAGSVPLVWAEKR